MASLSTACVSRAAFAGSASSRRTRPSARHCPIVRCQQAEDSAPLALDRRQILVTSIATAAAGAGLGNSAKADETCGSFTTAPNGLQFCDTVEGTGAEPVKGSLIRAHYTGRLASTGAKFDSSYDRGRPLTFKIGAGEVIQGWDKGILGGDGIPPMKEGGKRKLIIPSDLAYGERGAGRGLIPPGATLEFDVELLSAPGRR